MSDVPPEVISDILLPLPVKSLLRFRCVCKSWKALIDSPKFIKAQLKRQLQKPNSDLKLILKSKALFSVDFSSLCSGKPTPFEEMEHPLKYNGPTQVLGSCNGLVLISNSLIENGLWNPSTKKFRKLPVCLVNPLPPPSQGPGTGVPIRLGNPAPHSQDPDGQGVHQVCGGFGYDSSSDDYKVVRIAQWLTPSLVSETMVYSLNSGLWKKVEDCPNWLISEDAGAMLAGGVLHWIVSGGPFSPLILLGYNLGTESFAQVPYPENFGQPLQLNVAVLGECLCLLRGDFHVNSNAGKFVLERIDFWVMKEYGVKESWVKLFSVDQLDGRHHFSILRPIAYSVSGQEVLLEMDNRKFLWYNLDKKSLKHAKISGGLDSFVSFVNLGTLVPLYGGGSKKNAKKKIAQEIEDGAENIEEGYDHVVKEFKLEI